MKKSTPFLTATVALTLTASSFGDVTIKGPDHEFELTAGAMPTLFTGAATHAWVNSSLTPVHQDLHVDGIVTDGMITMFAVETGAGLSFVTLVDDNTGPLAPTGSLGTLGMETSAPATAGYWVNELGYDILDIAENAGMLEASGDFTWNIGIGDAWAWTGLENGDLGAMAFAAGNGAGISSSSPFQFLDWNGENWETAFRGSFDEGGNYDFQFAVPGPGSLAILMLAGFCGQRGRRRGA